MSGSMMRNDEVQTVSKIVVRRHLTDSQRAAAVVACTAWARPGNQPKPEPGSGLKTKSEMAETAGVSDRTIRQAKRAHEAGLGEAVRDGKVTAKEAASIAKLPEPERHAALEAPPESKSKPAPKSPAGEDEKSTVISTDGGPDRNIINESGLYSLGLGEAVFLLKERMDGVPNGTPEKRPKSDTPSVREIQKDLHGFLEVGKDFSAWMPESIEAFGFVEHQDFEVFSESGENSKGGRPRKEYMISISMAKELAMVQRTPKGKQARLYFIECEKKFRNSLHRHLPGTTGGIVRHNLQLSICRIEPAPRRLHASHQLSREVPQLD
jgi:phage anti-repressor protein